MRKGLALALALGAAALLPAAAVAGPADTTEKTIQKNDRGLLEYRDGEQHVTREELAKRTTDSGRRNLLFFTQMSDTHVIDEESPLRVEFTDKFGGIFTSAYRPQEGLTPQVLDQMVRRLRTATSPVDGRRLDLVMTTGDNTDNAQCNEARWMIDTMTGGREVDPDSGAAAGTAFSRRDLCLPGEDRSEQVTPPAPADCDPARAGRKYEGVRGGEYYEPDDDEGEDPRYTPLRNFPGLFEEMNAPFRTAGFGDIPWYAVFGNHDGLIQGNQPRNPVFEAIGVGCVKVTGLSEDQQQAFRDAPNEETAMARAVNLMRGASASTPGAKAILPDARRRPLRKDEWIAEHRRDADYGHGFSEVNERTGMGNYVLRPAASDARLRFIALDSISEHGLEEGNIDDDQFRWLHEQLLDAESSRERVVVFAHHSLRTMGQPPASPFGVGDMGGNLNPNVHFGEGPRNSGIKLPCTVTERTAPTTPGETLRCLLLRHPSVVGFVNGHEHANRIDPVGYGPQDGPLAPSSGGFWEINTAAHIDWPQQARLIDIVDNGDDTLSLFTTMVDHDAPPNPGEAGATPSVKRLASISRELSATEPQTGYDEARGDRTDRNAELVIRDPFPTP